MYVLYNNDVFATTKHITFILYVCGSLGTYILNLYLPGKGINVPSTVQCSEIQYICYELSIALLDISESATLSVASLRAPLNGLLEIHFSFLKLFVFSTFNFKNLKRKKRFKIV